MLEESKVYGEEEDEAELVDHNAEVSGPQSNSNNSVGDGEVQTQKDAKPNHQATNAKNQRFNGNEIDTKIQGFHSRKEPNEAEEDDEDILPSISSARQTDRRIHLNNSNSGALIDSQQHVQAPMSFSNMIKFS